MNPWDRRAWFRALGGALLGLIVVWLVTAASDEGQLTVGARAGRTLPLAPLCSAVGVALALGTSRVRQESRAFEALGRSPGQTGRAAALGAALPSILIAIAIAFLPSVDVSAFYPRAARGETFTFDAARGFVSPTLGVSIDAEGETHALEAPALPSEDLPSHARLAAALATAFAGLSFALVIARAALRRSLLDLRARRRLRLTAFGEAFVCAALMLFAFQAAAARVASAFLAVVPPLVLLAIALARVRWGFGTLDDRRAA